jgi:hypothetical protein
MLLTVITEAALKSPVSRISQFPGLDQPRRGKRKNALVRRQFRWRAGNAVFRQIGGLAQSTKRKLPAFWRSSGSPLIHRHSDIESFIDQIDQPVTKVEIQFNLRING